MKALDYDGLDHVVDKIMDLINSGGSADYIVEEGTSGIWTYRKWASGVYEAWGNTTATVAMTNAIQNTYYGNTSINISALGFTTMKSVNVTGQASGSYFGTKLEYYNTSEVHLSSRSSASSTTSVNFSIDIRGLWKEFTPSTSKATYPLGDYLIYRDFTSENKTLSAGSATTYNVQITVPDGYKYLCNVHTSVGGDIIMSFPSGTRKIDGSMDVYVFNNRTYSVTAYVILRVLFVKDI